MFHGSTVCTAFGPDLLVLLLEVIDALLLVGDGLLSLPNLLLVPLLRHRWAAPDTHKTDALGYNLVPLLRL